MAQLKFSSLNQVGSESEQDDAERKLAAEADASEAEHRGQPARKLAGDPATPEAPQARWADDGGRPEDETPLASAEGDQPTAAAEDAEAAQAAAEAEPKSPEDELAALEKTTSVAGFADLLSVAAGRKAPGSVTLGAAPVRAPSPFASAVPAAPAPATKPTPAPAGTGLASLLGDLGTAQPQAGSAASAPDAAGTGGRSQHKAAKAAPAAEAGAPAAEGEGKAGTARPQAMVPAGGAQQVAASVGEIAGRAAAAAIASPFLMLSSAARHLKSMSKSASLERGRLAGPASADESLLAGMSAAAALPILNSSKFITDWKRDRIESAKNTVLQTAEALRATEEFVVWDDQLRRVAEAKGVNPEQIVQQLATDPDYAELKTGMDAVWERHPELVTSYQNASDAFANHIRNVVKDFPNSADNTKQRVSEAMRSVVDETSNLPGFGSDLGEYQRTLAERIREQIAAIAQLLRRLMAKLGGQSADSELTP